MSKMEVVCSEVKFVGPVLENSSTRDCEEQRQLTRSKVPAWDFERQHSLEKSAGKVVEPDHLLFLAD